MSSPDAGRDLTPDEFSNWIPALLPFYEPAPGMWWQYAGNSALDDATVAQTIRRLRLLYPDREQRRSGLDVLKALASHSDSPRPDGFIFHMGRCGSTALSNALRCIDGAVCLSEPLALIDLLLPHELFRWEYSPDEWETLRGDLFTGTLKAFGRRRLGSERRFFIKFSDWNVLDMSFVKSLWPDVPCVYLYRDPVEVTASLMRRPPKWLLLRLLPAESIGLDLDEALRIPFEEYCARALGAFCRAAANGLDGGTALLSYPELSSGGVDAVAAYFGVDRAEIDTSKLQSALTAYAKDSLRSGPFVPDSEEKRRAVTGSARQMIDLHAMPAYAELERLAAAYPPGPPPWFARPYGGGEPLETLALGHRDGDGGSLVP